MPEQLDINEMRLLKKMKQGKFYSAANLHAKQETLDNLAEKGYLAVTHRGGEGMRVEHSRRYRKKRVM